MFPGLCSSFDNLRGIYRESVISQNKDPHLDLGAPASCKWWLSPALMRPRDWGTPEDGGRLLLTEDEDRNDVSAQNATH